MGAVRPIPLSAVPARKSRYVGETAISQARKIVAEFVETGAAAAELDVSGLKCSYRSVHAVLSRAAKERGCTSMKKGEDYYIVRGDAK